MKNIITLALLIYLAIAHHKKWTPFNEVPKSKEITEKPVVTKISSDDLRREYYKRISQTTNCNQQIIKLETEFETAINRIDTLVRIEYPKATWSFVTKNVGAGIILSTQLVINIVTYDGKYEERIVEMENHKVVRLSPICNAATPHGSANPEKVLFGQFNKTNESNETKDTSEESDMTKEKDTVDYVKKWFEDNCEHIESLQKDAIKNGTGSILIKKEMYKEEALQDICQYLVEKWGFEACSSTSEGIHASFYTE